MKFGKLHFACAVSALMATSVGSAWGEDAVRPVPEAIVAKFAKLDRNGDRRLSGEEFKSLFPPGQVAVALRDLDLFDLDADGQLSLDEFWSLPTHAIDQRGALPDPLTAVVDQFVGVLDQLFSNWDQEPKRTVPLVEFLGGFSKTLEEPITAQMQRDADPDRDRKITREEARRFVEIQAGVRRSDGKLLREPNGRVCQHVQFQNADLNRDERVTLAEFLERGYAGEKAAEIFQTKDGDHDGSLTWEEWCRFRMHDPIWEFRRIDINLDGQLEPAELLVGTPDWIKVSAKCAFPGFDTDHNGALSLDEYRLTMHSNPVANWNSVISDPDGDGVLTRSEFLYERRVPLLRFVYFGLLDQNGDGQLDPQEFSFKTKTRREFYSLNADGSGWQRMFGLEDFPSLGSPAISPDGKWIAFDGHGPKKDLAEQTMFITDFAGGNLRKLGLGMMPTWSQDGRQLSYSWQGVRVVNADGKDAKEIGNGWGAQWSPDGKRILSYAGLDIVTIDPISRASTTIYNARDNGYRQIFWNMAWSPDSWQVCFKGIKENGFEEIATISVVPGQPRFKVHHSGKNIANDFAWHPDGNRIVFCMHCPERAVTQLYEFNPNNDDAAELVKGQDPKSAITSVCWTPDGKQLIVITGDY